MSLLVLMAQNEEVVGQLYRAYTKKFPVYKELWEQLAQEEDVHASWLFDLQNKLAKGLIDIDINRFNESAVRTFSAYLKRELARLESEQISLINALSISLYAEKAFIEHKYFEVLESDSIELKNTLTKLKNGTEAHLQKVRKVWLQHR